jgi:acetyl esterase/lipase
MLRRAAILALFAVPLVLLLALVIAAPVTGPTAGSPRMWVRERYAVARASFAAWRLGYAIERDVVYSQARGREVSLTLYVPRARGPHPVVIFFHGGGWYEGNRAQASLIVRPYLEAGFAVANADYTLSGVARAPAAVHDAFCAVRWVAANAARHGLDTSRIVTAGISTGGHLALMAGLALPDAGPIEGCEERRSGQPRVAAVVNVYGPTDLPALLRYPAATGFVRAFVGTDTALARAMSPVSYVRRDPPVVVTIHGTDDSLVPFTQAQLLHAALRGAGARERLIAVPGGGHGFSRARTLALYDSVVAELRGLGVGPRR